MRDLAHHPTTRQLVSCARGLKMSASAAAISSNRTGAALGMRIRAAQGMLRFLARSPRSPSADSDGDRINGGNSILNGGGCRHRRAKRESRREQRQTDKNGEGEAVSCSGPTCRRVRPGTTGSLPPPPHALHAPATRHTPPSLRHVSSRTRLAGRGLSPLLQRVLMTLRSRPSGPPRVQPLAPPRQQRGSSTLRHGIRCERGINHGARRRRHSRTRFRCDGR